LRWRDCRGDLRLRSAPVTEFDGNVRSRASAAFDCKRRDVPAHKGRRMSKTRNGSTGNARPPAEGSHQPGGATAPTPFRERRSPTRPKFIEGWRKAVQTKVAQARASATAPASPTGRVDIWVANPQALLTAESCLAVLSPDDWAAMERIRDPASRRSAVAAQILLRIGLSRAHRHRVAPTAWRFGSGPNDKPTLAEGLPHLYFSVSHIDQLSVAAVSPTLDIGVDVECIDQNVSENIIAEFCHIDEQHSVGGLPHPQKMREFLRLWTLKEAYTKMTGAGHALDFKMIKFVLDPADLESGGEENDSQQPTLFENFFVSAHHALFYASLAIRQPPAPVGATEVQIISLADSEGRESGYAAPLSS
jgi:phosphopantetheinyl transferase